MSQKKLTKLFDFLDPHIFIRSTEDPETIIIEENVYVYD